MDRRRIAVSFIVGLIGIGLLHSSAQANMLAGSHRVHVASARLKMCPYLMRQLTAVGAHGVSCKRADAVARAYVLGHRHHLMGFRCRQVPVYQGGIVTDLYGVCRKGSAIIKVVPE
jgi:hypothetical protein